MACRRIITRKYRIVLKITTTTTSTTVKPIATLQESLPNGKPTFSNSFPASVATYGLLNVQQVSLRPTLRPVTGPKPTNFRGTIQYYSIPTFTAHTRRCTFTTISMEIVTKSFFFFLQIVMSCCSKTSKSIFALGSYENFRKAVTNAYGIECLATKRKKNGYFLFVLSLQNICILIVSLINHCLLHE